MARNKTPLCMSVEELESTYFPKQTKEQRHAEKMSKIAFASVSGQEQSSIKLRCRRKSNRLGIYFDQYIGGVRKMVYVPKEQFLNIEVSEQVRQDNLAKMVAINNRLSEERNKLLVEGIGIETSSRKGKQKLVDYINELADGELARTGNKQSYYYILQCLARHIEIYCGGTNITLAQANKEWCKGFLHYLREKALNGNSLKEKKKKKKNKNKKKTDKDKESEKPKVVKLSLNYQNQMYRKLNFVFNRAVENDLIPMNPMSGISASDKPKTESDTREFLTIDEIKVLYKTDCQPIQIKQAFLFCCLVGLRFSDVKALTWGNFSKDINGNTNLTIEMQKLKHLSKNVRTLNVQVSAEALRWLPERGSAEDTDLVFTLSDNEMCNHQLKRWVTASGITKKITWHCSRHTSATLNLNLGVPVEKVMKLMGHSKIATTQIYAKILAESLNDEVSKQNGIFD